MTEKLCINCRWVELSHNGDYHKCNAPKNLKVDLVAGGPSRRWQLCSTHRIDGWLECRMMRTCGQGARWFELQETNAGEEDDARD